MRVTFDCDVGRGHNKVCLYPVGVSQGYEARIYFVITHDFRYMES